MKPVFRAATEDPMEGALSPLCPMGKTVPRTAMSAAGEGKSRRN
jgi:hypothetical protein